ncbi:MAG: alpha-galactosidase, partial [Verrucomicrobiota bacterium]
MSYKIYLVGTLSTASLTSRFKVRPGPISPGSRFEVQSSRFEVRSSNLQPATCNLQPIRVLLPLFRAASLLLLLASAPALPAADSRSAPAQPLIRITTAHSTLALSVGNDGRVYQLSYGSSDAPLVRTNHPSRCMEFHPQYGDGFIFEPALAATHADGNTSTDLTYVKHSVASLDPNTALTRIELKDPAYPFFVTLNLKSYRDQDVIEQWTEIRHDEKSSVTLDRFASSAPVFPAANSYWITHFHGDWAKEAQWVEERLSSGIKILDSKIGVRADQYRTPLFMLALNHEAREEEGEVFGGTLEWSGSFQFAFEMDANECLRVLSGINPFASHYRLPPGQIFTTPAMLWSWSGQGKGQVSRNFHRWARRYGIRDGDKPRPVLLNNWEATGFDFDERKII